jgi:hypothetical protein
VYCALNLKPHRTNAIKKMSLKLERVIIAILSMTTDERNTPMPEKIKYGL